MNVIRRLIVLGATLAVIASGNTTWFGLNPSHTSLNSLIKHFSLNGHSINIDLFNNITLAQLITGLALILAIAAVVGKRALTWVTLLCDLIVISFVTLAQKASLDSFFSVRLGWGSWLMLLSCILLLLALLLPAKKAPAK